ncbi:DUF1653 domain-containing protein [Aminipila sp.]|uniref:DUF1653 domain-containing protein n=1 Tax=Aminipila sp. TaxID=2060095 RepID=UPI00289AAF9F|nr:DUF1653 domain-containing protein [Aminipila sp.]
MNREVSVKRLCRHLKGKLYYFHAIVIHTNRREVGLLSGLYEPYGMFVRPLAMLTEKVKPNSENNITKRTYKFELFNGI